MKILQLEVEGFRSLKHVVWKPGDLNVIIGPNASGKSNLLKVLEMLQAAAQGRLSKYIIREGGMGAIVWDGSAEEIRIRLEVSHEEPKGTTLIYELILARLWKTASYKIVQEDLSVKDREGKKEKLIERTPVPEKEEVSIGEIEPRKKEETFLAYGIGSGSNVLARFKQSCSECVPYLFFRTDPGAPVRQDSVSRYEKVLEPDGQNLVAVLHTLYAENRDFEEEIDLAMKAAFGENFDKLVFPPSSDQRVQLRIRWNGLKTPQSAANLSDGTLRFLYLMAILANPEPPPLVAIDEPETGLHPSMMPLVAAYAAQASERTQVILTTHSPEFLDGFYKIATPTTTVTECREGETMLRVISDGKLAYWVKRYTLGELFRTTELEQME